MAFHSMAAFLHMGGFASFVWSAYGLVAGGIVLLCLYNQRRLHRLKKTLKLELDEPQCHANAVNIPEVIGSPSTNTVRGST